MLNSFLHNPSGVGDFCHCSSIFLYRDRLHLVWYAYPEDETSQASLIYSSKAVDPAADWSKPRIILRANGSLGNPFLWTDDSGVLVLFYVALNGTHWTDANVMVALSQDTGLTWSPPSQVSFQAGLMIRHPPILAKDRSLWVPTYDERSYTSSIHRFLPPDFRLHELHHFDYTHLIQPCLISHEDVLLATFRPVDHPRSIHVARSGDGVHWSNIFDIQLPSALSGHASFAWKDHLGIVLNHTHKHQRFPLSLSISSLTNLRERRTFDIDNVSLELSYPSVAVDHQGGVHISYSYNRRMIKYCYLSLQEWMERER